MEARQQGRERGILKLEPRSSIRSELTPQASWERQPVSPQPSVDRLSVTWAEPEGSMTSAVNLFHMPSEPLSNEVTFSPNAGAGSDDEDYSASLSAVLRQRRASVRRSRKGRGRRPSSPFLPDEPRGAGPRRRSSVFTTSSGDTAISMEDQSQPAAVTQEQIFENIHLHKEVLGSVKQQPLGMRRKLKIVHQAKTYIKRHQGQLQERLAQSKSTRDIYARINILINTKWQQMKREAANMSNLLIPWELRIKEIESHFGSVVASYFTFLRWLFWVNLVIGSILMLFVIVPEYLTANPMQDGERKIIMEEDRRNATNLLTLWEFEGVLKCSPIFYGYYTNIERPEYRMPLAYFLTGLVVYIYSFVATLRKMAENSRMSKLSEKEDECIFSWKLFTGWDYMIGNTETAQNRIASVILGFKEALLEEAEKKKDLRNWRIISRRILVNICVVFLLFLSAFVVVTVVSRSDENAKGHNWWSENETTVVVTCISISFPLFFEALGIFEHYHPRKQLRLQLGRIMFLNLLNLYSLIFALFSKIEGMTAELDNLKPPLNGSTTSESMFNITETLAFNLPSVCKEVQVDCGPDNVILSFTLPTTATEKYRFETTVPTTFFTSSKEPAIAEKMTTKRNEKNLSKEYLMSQNLLEYNEERKTTTRTVADLSNQEQMKKLNEIIKQMKLEHFEEESDEIDDDEYSFDTDDVTESTPSLDARISTVNTITDVPELYSTLSSDDPQSSFPTVNGYSDYNNNMAETTDYETFASENYSSSTESESTGVPGFTNEMLTTLDITDDITTDADETDEFTKSDTTLDADALATMIDLLTSLVSQKFTSSWYNNDFNTSISPASTSCPYISFNCTVHCSGNNITQVFTISNCSVIKRLCYVTRCEVETAMYNRFRLNQTNETLVDVVYFDEHQRKMYNLTTATKKKLTKLCWETMFGQELVKLTMMDLIFVLLGTLFWEFFRALFVRYCNRCWCWDLEKRCPQYGDFKIAENILHLINNQGMVWMGMFFSPGLALLNVIKLVIMMYLRSWAVMTCNVPHEVVFRVSKSNNFYLALLLTMLFLCVLPVGYSIVWVKPSWHCGPFSEYEKIYHIVTSNILSLPKGLKFALECIASPAIVIPILVLLILIIYYLASLTNSLREANNDLKIQLRRERTEERRKMFQLADNRGRAGSSALDNTPFGRWKRALPTLPLSKSIDSDERKPTPGDDTEQTKKTAKKRGGIFAKIVNLALDRKVDVEAVSEIENDASSPNVDEETDTDFHETLPRDVLKIKDITIANTPEPKKKIDIRTIFQVKDESNKDKSNLKVQNDKEEKTDMKAVLEKLRTAKYKSEKSVTPEISPVPKTRDMSETVEKEHVSKKLTKKQISESSNQSKQSDSISSVIPVITISTTESDEELLQAKSRKQRAIEKKEDGVEKKKDAVVKIKDGVDKRDIDTDVPRVGKKGSSEIRSLRRQSSVDSVNEHKSPNKKPEDGHKYQYSL